MGNPDDQVVLAAWLYYVEDRNQQQIADAMAVSRPTVSRLLQRARDEGVVEIKVRATLPRAAEQERKLLAAFPGLTAATVVPESLTQPTRSAVARACANLVEDIVDGHGGCVLAVGWGRTLGEVATQIHPRSTRNVTIVDAVGYAPSLPGASSLEVTRTLVQKIGARAVHLPMPAMLRPRSAARAIMETEQVSEAMRLARDAPTALVSLGAATLDSPLRGPGLLTLDEWRDLLAQGVVGDLLGHFLDGEGSEHEVEDVAWIGLSLDDLRAKERVIGLVTGVERASIAAVAIKAGLITHLIVDIATVDGILDQASSEAARYTPAARP